jgi:hypothetical protein
MRSDASGTQEARAGLLGELGRLDLHQVLHFLIRWRPGRGSSRSCGLARPLGACSALAIAFVVDGSRKRPKGTRCAPR